jgi:hypothetical protein
VIAYDAVELFDRDFGPRLVSVTPPGCAVSPHSQIRAKDCGKAPGYLTPIGWTGADVNDSQRRCLDYQTATLWRDNWRSNVGFVVGDGYVVFDNDQGSEFSDVLMALLKNPLRRYVDHPQHSRDAFLVRVLDFVGDGVAVRNADMVFRNGVTVGKFSVLAKSKQAVISGMHPDRMAPYVWNREIEGIASIPVLSEDGYEAFLREFVAELNAKGWVLTTGSATILPFPPAVSGAPGPAPDVPLADLVREARELLARMPNRPPPPRGQETPVDLWLEPYDNWIKLAYALAAFFGVLHARSPEARAVWLDWVGQYGRSQPGQDPSTVWESAIRNTSFSYNHVSLVRIVQQFGPGPANFPDVDPDDLKSPPPVPTPIWDGLRARWTFCVAQHGGKGGAFISVKIGTVVPVPAFNNKFRRFAKALRAEISPGRGPIPSVSNMFLAQPDRPEVADITYAPGEAPMLDDPDGSKLEVFNRWRRPVLATLPVSAADVQVWLDHLEFVLGSPAARDKFLSWCAFVVQHPAIKPNWHPLLMSDPGYGKDTMVIPLKLAVGRGNYTEGPIDALTQSFNYALEHKLVIVSEVAQRKGAQQGNFDAVLKSVLAAPPDHHTINLKGLHPYRIPNRTAVVMFSNEQRPVDLARGDRRIHVIDRLGQPVQSPAYYENLRDWFAAGGPAGLTGEELCAAYLAQYPLSEADRKSFLGRAPASPDKDELVRQSDPKMAALEDLLEEMGGLRGVADASELTQALHDRGQRHISGVTVSNMLLDMERAGKGVRRRRIDPKNPRRCGMVTGKIHGMTKGGRLWLLTDRHPDGRAWNTLSDLELIAYWKNITLPNATIITHPNASLKPDQFPDDNEDIV